MEPDEFRSVEIVSGATVSADGVQGMPYSSSTTSYGTGGGGSGGSILMEACNVSGAGLVSAKGGPSRGGIPPGIKQILLGALIRIPLVALPARRGTDAPRAA